MAVVLVTGGSGTLGRHLVPLLRDRGDEVRVLSRRADGGTHVGDLTTGAGVAAAVAGAETIVHLASDPPRGAADLAQTEQLLTVAGEARHLLYVSIVGIDEIPLGYYRRKLAFEQAIAGSGLPVTIARITQFHELLADLMQRAARLPVAPLPLSFRFQTIAAADAAAHVAALAAGEPQGRADDAGGPEVLTLREMAAAWRAARGRPRVVVPFPPLGRVGRGFRAGLNTCPDRVVGTQRWAEFVAPT